MKPFFFALVLLGLCGSTARAAPLTITDFYARRDPAVNRVRVAVFVRNDSAAPLNNPKYTFSRFNAGKWEVLKTATFAPIQPGKPAAATFDLPLSYEARSFKVDVLPSTNGSKEFTLAAAPGFVVKYRAVDWQRKNFSNGRNELIGKRARDFQNTMKGLGFATKIKYDTFDGGPFGRIGSDINYLQWVDYRLIDFRERFFPTRAAADAFSASLPPGVTKQVLAK